MKSRLDEDIDYSPVGTLHFNVQHLKSVLWYRVSMRHFRGCSPSEIEWVWMVEARRHATREEIIKLCAGKLPWTLES